MKISLIVFIAFCILACEPSSKEISIESKEVLNNSKFKSEIIKDSNSYSILFDAISQSKQELKSAREFVNLFDELNLKDGELEKGIISDSLTNIINKISKKIPFEYAHLDVMSRKNKRPFIRVVLFNDHSNPLCVEQHKLHNSIDSSDFKLGPFAKDTIISFNVRYMIEIHPETPLFRK